MGEVPDYGWMALGVAIAGLFVWYFWHTAVTMIRYARQVVDFMDTRSERLRQKLEYEAIHGRPPLWYRMMQKLIIVIVIAGAAALVWKKFTGA